MPVCSYYGQLNCSGPVFGGRSSSLLSINSPHPATHNIFNSLLGTNHFTQALSIALYYIIIRYLIWPLIMAPLFQVVKYRRLKEVKLFTLEVRPLQTSLNDKNGKIDGRGFANTLHELGSLLPDSRWLKRRAVIGLEMLSTRSGGIRYFVHVPKEALAAVEQALAAYMPEAKVRRTTEKNSTPVKNIHSHVIELKQSAHYAYPLKDFQAESKDCDPLTYISSAMSGLEQNESVIYQIILSPAPPRIAKKARQNIKKGKILSPSSMSWRTSYIALFKAVGWLLLAGANLANKVLGSSDKPSAESSNLTSILAPTIAADQAKELILAKLNQPLFYTNLRLLINCVSEKHAKERELSLLSALSAYSEPGYQKLVPSTLALTRLPKAAKFKYQLFTLTKLYARLPSMLNINFNVLSANEIESLFHLPQRHPANIGNIELSTSRTLPLPPSLKLLADSGQGEVEIGRNFHQGNDSPIVITAEERARHVYIIGGTGTGKTTMIEHMAIQDMIAGRGIAVIDPHGDLAKTLLEQVPPKRVDDVIVFNPEDLLHPIGLNLLEIPKGAHRTDEELEHEKELITEAVVSIFRKIFSRDDSGGHRVEYILRSAIQTALTIEGATMFTVLKLIQDPYYRSHYVEILEDDVLKDFWKNEFGPAGGMQRVKMSAGVTAKLGRFWHSAAARRIFSQQHSTIDFADIMDKSKILICNFSKGALGEDVSELFGTAVLAKLQLSALRRNQIAADKRQPFYLFIDEFQNFATDSFAQMLSESRKYNLRLTLAEQSTAQQKDQLMVEVILANVANVVCFRSASSKDEQRFLPMFAPHIEAGEISNLPIYTFYAKLSGTNEVHPPISGHTVLTPNQSDTRTASIVTQRSQHLYSGHYTKPIFETNHLRPGNIPVPKFKTPSRPIRKSPTA